MDQWSWQWFDGKRWAPDKNRSRYRAAKSVVRMIHHEAGECLDDDQRKDTAKWARLSENQTRIEAMLSLARSELPIAACVEDFDRDPLKLNVLNGTIDLLNGDIRPHNPGDMITKLAPVTYDPAATAPTFATFLAAIIPSETVRAYLQRWAGYASTASTREEKVSIWWGGGSNGKTTLARALQRTLGDYARQIDPDVLMMHRGEQHPTGKASFYGVRAAFASETGEGRKLAENTVKGLSSNDLISARYMRQDFFEFAPTHSLALLTNHKPEIHGTDLGIWRRLDLVPFTVTIKPEDRDEQLPEKLQAEASGILNWIIAGAIDWCKSGLPRTEEIITATEEYREESDILADFIDDKCLVAPKALVSAKELYAAYTEWCEGGKEKPLTKKAFALRLKERGLVSSRSRRARLWIGITLRSSDGETPEDTPKADLLAEETLRQGEFVTDREPVTRCDATFGMNELAASRGGVIRENASQRVTEENVSLCVVAGCASGVFRFDEQGIGYCQLHSTDLV